MEAATGTRLVLHDFAPPASPCSTPPTRRRSTTSSPSRSAMWAPRPPRRHHHQDQELPRSAGAAPRDGEQSASSRSPPPGYVILPRRDPATSAAAHRGRVPRAPATTSTPARTAARRPRPRAPPHAPARDILGVALRPRNEASARPGSAPTTEAPRRRGSPPRAGPWPGPLDPRSTPRGRCRAARAGAHRRGDVRPRSLPLVAVGMSGRARPSRADAVLRAPPPPPARSTSAPSTPGAPPRAPDLMAASTPCSPDEASRPTGRCPFL